LIALTTCGERPKATRRVESTGTIIVGDCGARLRKLAENILSAMYADSLEFAGMPGKIKAAEGPRVTSRPIADILSRSFFGYAEKISSRRTVHMKPG